MNQRQRKTFEPCDRCRMNAALCFCAEIPLIATRTRVSVLIHAKELKRTTNTGRLATLTLENSGLYIRGLESDVLDASTLLNHEEQTFLFFPSNDSVELTSGRLDGRPVHLIVPDGNWRQAAKVNTRYPEFSKLTRVKIASRAPATYYLRKETTPEGMATLQAIAEALGVTDGPEVRAKLLALYELKLLRTMKARGIHVNP